MPAPTPASFPVLNPATETPIGEVPNGDIPAATRAVDRAAAAFTEWSQTSPRHRSEILRRTFDFMLRDKDRLAQIISTENGKSLADSAGEVTYAAEFFRWFSEEAVRSGGDFGPSPAGGTRTLVHHKPVGVAALVTPWNFPAAMATRKIAPALAAGCTAVFKPAAETPLTALAIGELLAEAGLPDGVLEIVTTTDSAGVVSAWLDDARIRKLSFTGSTGVGSALLRHAAERIVNASMELGGNAPFIVTQDADLDAAVTGALLAKFRNGGQACTAANRFYIHADVAAAFTEKFSAALKELTVGPAADGHDIGPLISAKALAGLTRTVDAAVAEGARIHTRLPIPEGAGFFFAPQILTDIPAGATILQEELFGPVVTIVTWTDDEELIRLANATEFGLAAYLYSGELGRGLRLAERLDAGMVGINRGLVSDPAAPFGGVKQSGLGREGARVGLEEFQETQYFSVAWN